MSLKLAREQITDRARANGWHVTEYSEAVTVAKSGSWITVRFGGRGEITRVGTNMGSVSGSGKLGRVLRLMGTLPAG